MRINNESMGGVFAASIARLSGQIAESQQRLAANSRLAAGGDTVSISMASRLRSQISGHTIGMSAARDGQSLGNLAADALTGIGDLIDELRTLAVEWNSGSGDKASIRERAGELGEQLASQINSTVYNDTSLLKGGGLSLQIGPNAGDSVSVSFADADAIAGGVFSSFAAAADTDTIDLDAIDAAGQAVEGARGEAAALSSRMGHAISHSERQIETLMSAQNRVEGLDVAAELTKLTGLQIRQNMAAGLLAQTHDHNRELISQLLK